MSKNNEYRKIKNCWGWEPEIQRAAEKEFYGKPDDNILPVIAQDITWAVGMKLLLPPITLGFLPTGKKTLRWQTLVILEL